MVYLTSTMEAVRCCRQREGPATQQDGGVQAGAEERQRRLAPVRLELMGWRRPWTKEGRRFSGKDDAGKAHGGTTARRRREQGRATGEGKWEGQRVPAAAAARRPMGRHGRLKREEPGDEFVNEYPVEYVYEEQAFDNPENFAAKMIITPDITSIFAC
ncbi:hypothetical protein CFC21_001300 [Triticum aestivum]|nr:hypothetical protein CFC21_001300 [Triticum aestivum]